MWANMHILFKGLPSIPISSRPAAPLFSHSPTAPPFLLFVMLSLSLRGHTVTLFTGSHAGEEQNRGKPNWEHLNEDLHVLITVEDTQGRAEMKMRRAVEEVKKLLVPAAEGEDNLKKMQLMELAILNGTYRDNNLKTPAAAAAQGQRLITSTGQVLPPQGLRPQTPGGGQIMNLIRQPQMAAMMSNGTPTLVPPSPDGGLIYTTPYDYPYALAPTSLLEYPIDHSGVLGKRAWASMGPAGTANFGQPGHEGSFFYPGAGMLDAAAMSHSQDLLKGAMASKVRRHDTRVHPYQRIVTADRDFNDHLKYCLDFW
ncbi:Protein quaking-A [Dissostichus eleginoides]|uniref:Protein quaking-A n=1 Tax=Dissostichus eleginoides TaxID=100907 RepID=A0AAD9C280_DISEL|nr:Protein quaking-A [Dissostichus eleginoides]